MTVAVDFLDSTCNDKRKSFTELCCHGALTSTVGLMKPACCGFIAFDSQTNICCHGEIHPKADKVRPACCGRGVYDESKEVCCTNNRVLPGSSCS